MILSGLFDQNWTFDLFHIFFILLLIILCYFTYSDAFTYKFIFKSFCCLHSYILIKIYFLFKGCDQSLTGSSGLITSPNYPLPYTFSSKCQYHITAPAGQTITLYPINFDIESHQHCRFDHLGVYDGADGNAPQLGKNYCGTQLPPTMTSSGNQMHLIFITDKYVTKSGFAFSYTMSPGGMYLYVW